MMTYVNVYKNIDYWEKKLYGNSERDERNRKELEDRGCKVITVWECELKKEKVKRTLEELYAQILSQWGIFMISKS